MICCPFILIFSIFFFIKRHLIYFIFRSAKSFIMQMLRSSLFILYFPLTKKKDKKTSDRNVILKSLWYTGSPKSKSLNAQTSEK